MLRSLRIGAACLVVALGIIGIGGAMAGAAGLHRSGAAVRPLLSGGKIQHVVVVLQENHSLDEVLGALCMSSPGRCDGSLTGKLKNGSVIQLHAAPDVPPIVAHSVAA